MLTLAEADGELQRLSILRRNHTDEQFLARRRLRELPDELQQLEQLQSDLQQDHETLRTHQDEGLKIGGRAHHPSDVNELLGNRLKSFSARQPRSRKLTLGTKCGLRFGVTADTDSRVSVFVDGATSMTRRLAGGTPGPRAVLNALDRIIEELPQRAEKVRVDIAQARKHLEDYRDRVGTPFEYEAYFSELSSLRNELNDALSRPEMSESGRDTANELATRIKQLIDRQSVKTTGNRPTQPLQQTTEVPIATRLRRYLNVSADTMETDHPDTCHPETERTAAPAAQDSTDCPGRAPARPHSEVVSPERPPADFRDRVASEQRDLKQRTLF